MLYTCSGLPDIEGNLVCKPGVKLMIVVIVLVLACK
jgi:hypothetical protein